MDDEERRRAAGIRSMDDEDEPRRGLNTELRPTRVQVPEARAGWGSKLGAAVDSMESQGYGIAEAMGIDSARRGRLDNAIAADRTNQAADEQLGIAGSWDEAHGVGGTAKYLASQGINTIPQMAVTTAASLVNPALGASAAYGFALGDVLENQREQSGGTNLPSAMAVAAPYAASDYALGIQGKITRGLAVRGIVEEAVAAAPSRINLIGRAEHALEGKTGMAGFAGRRALEAGKTFGEEAGSETFQELMNQTGRIAVDPNASYMDDDALQRYKESFIVGGALGGVTGGVTGGKYGAKAHALENEPAPTKGNTPIGEKGVPEMGSGGPVRNDTTSILDQTGRNKINQSILDYGRQQGGSGTHGPGGGVAAPTLTEDAGNWAPTAPPNILDRQSEGDRVNQQLLGNGRGLPTGSPVAAQVGQEVNKAFPVPPPQTAQQQSAAQDRADTVAGAQEHAAGIQKLVSRAAEHGVGEKEALLFGSLEGALKTGLIDKPSFIVGVGNLASGNKQLIADTKKGIAALEAQHELNQKAAAAPAGGLQLGPAEQTAAPAETQAPAGAQAPAANPVQEAAAQRAVAEVKERLSPGKVVTAAAMKKNNGKPISPLLRRRLYQRLGLDEEGWPRAEKRTLAEIAQIEADEKGEGKLDDAAMKKKAKAIQTMLAGFGFSNARIEAAIDAMKDQDHGLDTRTVDPGVTEGQEVSLDQIEGHEERGAPKMSEGQDVEDVSDFDEGSAPAEQKTDEELAAEEEGGEEEYFGSGMGVKSSATSSADRQRLVAREHKSKSGLLAKAPDLSESQQALFAAVAELPDAKVQGALDALLADEEVFSPKEREMLAEVFKTGKSEFAEAARDETVQEARDIASTDKAAEEALAARNMEVIAKNARDDAAKKQRAEALARQVEEMDPEESLMAAVPVEMHEDIDGAAREWEEYQPDGAPPWHGLATDLQAQWVKGFSQSLDMTSRKAQEARVAVSEAVGRKDAARRESATAAADRAAQDTESAITAAQQREELRGLATQQEESEKTKAEKKAERERKVGTTTVRTKRGKLNAKDTEATGGGGGTVADAGPRAETDQRQAPGRSEGSHGAANAVPAAERTGSVDQEGSHPPADQDRGAASGVEDVHGDYTTVATQAPLMAEPPAGRKPSVKVELRRANKEVAKGKITEAEALARVTEVAEAAAEHESDKRSNAQLVRDADHTRAQLLEGRRSGDLDPDMVELADWFIRKNPQLVRGLAISIKSAAKDKRGNEIPGPVGTYESMRRIMTLIKNRANPLTAVHEILHHTERMLPRPLREALTRAWIKALFKAKRAAEAGTDENLKKFFDALMYYHFDEASKYGSQHPSVALKDAMDLLKSGKVSANLYYQYVNSSEFWAVNGSRIVQGRFDGSEGLSHRMKAWLREFVQKLKGMVGMQSDAPIIKALDSLAKGDGKFLTGTMLSEGSGVGGVHNSYVGPEAHDQEAQANKIVAEQMEGAGKSPADIHLTTGWFRNPYDNLWRYEVSDDHMAFTQPFRKFNVGAGKYTLKDVLHHDELFKRYPELKDVKVHIFEGGNYGHYEGFFSPPENTIGINREQQGSPEDTILHEIQHWIQHKEGFAVGSSSSSIAYELNDKQAVEVGGKIAREHKSDLDGYRDGAMRLQQFLTHPTFPALIAAYKQSRADMKNASLYKGRSSLPNDKAIASMQRWEQLKNQITADITGVHDLDAFVGSPTYGMLHGASQFNSVHEAWAAYGRQLNYINEYEGHINDAAAGNREQIARLGYNSPHLHEAYTRSAGEQEAEEVARRREMDEDFRTYFAPFPMTETGLNPSDAVVSFENKGTSARERENDPMALTKDESNYMDRLTKMREERSALLEKQNEVDMKSRRNFLLGMAGATASVGGVGYVGRDRTTIGRAKPITEAVLESKVSQQAQKLLRGTTKQGATNPDGLPNLRAALTQMAKDQPELAGLIDRVRKFLPAGGLALTIEDDGEWNAHGAVVLGDKPELKLMTAGRMRGFTYGTILHELLHAGVGARYHALSVGTTYDNYNKTKTLLHPKAMGELRDFAQVWEEFKRSVTNRDLEGLDKQTKLAITEAHSNPDEFFVRALTDPHLQEWMSKREYKGKTLLERFKDWVATKLFGMGATGVRPSWLDAALEASQQVTDKGTLDPGDWGFHKKARQASVDNPMLPSGGLSVLRSAVTGTEGDTTIGQRKPDQTTAAYKAQNRTVLGRAIPLDPAKAKTNMSMKAERLLRAGTKDGETNPEATQAIKAALRQIARDYPELSKVANTVVGLMPEKGIALQVDGKKLMNVHGYVDFKGQPTMYLFTAEGREGLTPATFVHEALHAVVGARYYMLQYGMAENNYAKLGISKPQAMAALNDFKTFYDEFNAHVRAFVKEGGGTLDGVTPALRSSLNEAGTNPDELFVRALTDPVLQQWLAQREYTGGSLLDKFKRWVSRNLFNITTGTRPSWLDAAMTASNALAKASKADEANWETHRAMNDRMGGAKAGEVLPDTVTNRVIDEHVQKLPKHLQPGAKFGLRSIVNGAKRGISWITTTEDMVRLVEKAMPAARRYSDAMRNIVFERQNAQLVAERILHTSKNLAPGEREKASNFMRDSTLAKKWGYKPAYVANAEVDPAMATKFMALLPETRKAVQEAFEHMHDNLVGMREAVVAAAEQAHGTDEAAKTRAIAKYDRLMAMSGDWPYMPLSRFGDFTAVGRSAAFRDIEERLKEDPKNKALREQYDQMEVNPAHYEVQFGQTEAHAQAIADDMRGRFDHVEHFARDETHIVGAGSDMFAAVARLRNLAADSGFSETSARTLQKLVNDLHLSLLSERSARQSERSRKGVAGFNDDMWRNFGSRAKSAAHFLASTRAMGDVQNHLAALKRDANVPGTVEGLDRASRSKYYNEFMRRHMAEMVWKPNSFVDNAMATTSFWKLLSSPSYLMMNLTQPWVMSAPVLAGRHGIGATISEMGKAYAQLIPLVRAGELAPGKFKNMPRDVQAGIDALIKQGLISVSLEGELGKYGEGADAFLVTKGLKMTGDFLSNLSTKSEDMNRLATAIAALRLERRRGASPEAAIKYAGKILYDTHGDYSGFNAPPWMRTSFGRFASQFRKFQIMQVGLWAKMAHDAFMNSGLNATERWAAMKSLGYSLGTMGMLGGVLGMPGATVIALMLGAAFGDPDEPNNPELAMRKWIGNDDLADLILKGVPAYLGMDVSSRIGAGDIFSVLPYSDPEVSKTGVDRMLLKVLGPAIGMLEDTADGVGMMMNGDYWKGLEKIAPRGIADVSKGVRLASQGFTNKAGEVTVKGDDVGVAAGVMQAMGLSTQTLTDRSFRASAKYTQDKYYTSQTLAVKKNYTEAYLDGDTDRMREARDQWTNMQAARKGLGYKPSPLSDLLKAPADRAKHEQQTIGGVQYRGQRDEGAARQLAEL